MKHCKSSFLLLLLPLLLLMVMLQSVSSVPLVHAPWGALQGVSMTGSGGRKMDAYLGIPYAVPPVGERRFEKPMPHPGPGEGEVFVADKIMPPCPQRPVLIGSTRKTSEDCLQLDVYVPAEDTDSTTTTADPSSSHQRPYAVMVFIHGGGLYSGDAHSYRPSKLVADGKVIVVIMQYRLGVLGFLSSGDGAVPENVGLWDQNLALRWVKKNIHSFGGDPDRITIFGESAGSWSVGFHLIIPQSRGLFNRAIMQSGAPQDLIRFMNFYDEKTIFKDLTDRVGCKDGGSRERFQCLKQQPLGHLMKESDEYANTSPLFSYYFPVVDGELILREPRELVQDLPFLRQNGVGDVDIILGFNKHEGSIVLLSQVFRQLPMDVLYSTEFFNGTMDMCFIFAGLGDNTVLKKAVEFFYRGAESGSNFSRSLDPVVDMLGDCFMNAPITEWARHLAVASRSAALYMYVVEHDFAFNSQGPLPGSHHIDELLLLFDNDHLKEFPEDSLVRISNKTFLSAEEDRLSSKMVDMWTTFARTGNPSGPLTQELGGPWPQFTVQEELYLSVSTSPHLLSRMGPYADRVALWLQLLPQLQAETSRPAPQEAAEGQGSAREEL